MSLEVQQTLFEVECRRERFRIQAEFLCRPVRDTYLTEDAIEAGAGVEDICQFWHWFDQRMWPSRRPDSCCGDTAARARPEPPPAARRATGQLARR